MAHVTVRKNNKVLNIEDTRLESYLLQGYDQIDKSGNIVAKATGGRMVSLAEHNKVLDELEALKKSPADTDKLQNEIEELKKENSSLKSKITKLEKAAKQQEPKE